MALHEDFKRVFAFNPRAHLSHETVDHILKTRRKYEGLLFVDRLFKLVGLKEPTKIYPPKSNNDLQQLHATIIATSAPAHHIHSLIYYLLLDSSPLHHTSGPLQDFLDSVALPYRYRLFISGLHYLDRQNFHESMEYLTEPSLLPTFPDDILYVLLTYTPPAERYLADAYYNCVQPPLSDKSVRNAYFSHLSSASLQSAFLFARARDAATHQEMLEHMIWHTLAQKDAGEMRVKRCMKMINLPLSMEEEEWFDECLLRGKARGLHGARDMVIVRRMIMGRNMNDLGELNGMKIGGLDWDVIMNALAVRR